MIPITVASILFKVELVSAAFERGAFTAQSAEMTSGVFALYSIGIFFIACNTVITNLFYGYGNTKTPMFISIANLAINVVLNLVLIRFLGANGLALSTSVSAAITFFIRLKASGKYIKLDGKRMIITALKVLLASVFACFVPRIIFWVFPINRYLVLSISAITAIGIYLFVMKLFRIAETDELIGMIRKRLKSR